MENEAKKKSWQEEGGSGDMSGDGDMPGGDDGNEEAWEVVEKRRQIINGKRPIGQDGNRSGHVQGHRQTGQGLRQTGHGLHNSSFWNGNQHTGQGRQGFRRTGQSNGNRSGPKTINESLRGGIGHVVAEAMFVNREEVPVYPVYRDPSTTNED